MAPPPPFPRPCLDCGTLTPQGNRCQNCEQKARARRPKQVDSPQRKARKRQLYNSTYQKQAKFIRQTATHCHLCGQGPRAGDPFQADHLIPGDLNSPLLPAHRSCNASKGNTPPKA